VTRLDRLIQKWRIQKIRPYLTSGARVLDIGCADGRLLQEVPDIGEYVGIDPHIALSHSEGRGHFVRGCFPEDLPDQRPFDVITMLAVLEHIPSAVQPEMAHHCARLLRPEGYLLITVPSPVVDHLLAALKMLRLIDGMSLEQHYGFQVDQTDGLFSAQGLTLVRRQRFQFGLNNLFVFQKAPAGGPDSSQS